MSAAPGTPALRSVLLRRAIFAAALVFVASSAAFMLVHLAPGDAVSEEFGSGMTAASLARERAALGLDRPIAWRYVEWLAGVVRLDFGISQRYGRPVLPLVAERAANTAIVAVAALTLATLIGLPLGVLAGSRPRSFVAAVVRSTSLLVLSVPPLVLSLTLVLVAARTGWLPIGGRTSAGDAGGVTLALDIAWHAIVPALSLAIPLAALLERLEARAIVTALARAATVAATARGIPRTRIIWSHAVRAGLGPVAAFYGAVAGSLLSGSFAVELVTAWPGLGRLMVDALTARDGPLVAGCMAAGAALVALACLAGDAVAALADPRAGEAA